jgi:S-adenosylmethionine:tRNA ribosyltransferase-isomerase
MRIDDFDFDLPDSAIATRPMEPREAARLLLLKGTQLEDRAVGSLPSILKKGDRLVFNNTRVIPARLFGTRGIARVEFLLHKADAQDPSIWQSFAKPAKRLSDGDEVVFAPDFKATVLGRAEDKVVIRFTPHPTKSLFELLEAHGHMPLPPYITRADDAQDQHDYQTVFAARDGAVAAPTASLHFTEELLAKLEAIGVDRSFITLHVGAGTFQPVRVDNIADHKMHSEWAELDAKTCADILATKQQGGRVIAVGTTVLRTLESAARHSGTVQPFCGETDIFITPGFTFKVADGLMTNFHLPRSTLLMLVSAFVGHDTMKAMYAHAIATGYRFYSYGDTSLLLPHESPST